MSSPSACEQQAAARWRVVAGQCARARARNPGSRDRRRAMPRIPRTANARVGDVVGNARVADHDRRGTCPTLRSLPGYCGCSSFIRATAGCGGSRTTSIVCASAACRGSTRFARDTARGERLDPRVGRGFGSKHAERNGELPRAGVDDGQIVDRRAAATPPRACPPARAEGDRTDVDPPHRIGGDRPLRHESAELQRLDVRLRRARSASENGPHSTQTSANAATFAGRERRNLLRRQHADALRLHLRAEPSRFALRRAIEPRITEQDDVREDQQQDGRARSAGT